MFSYYCNGPAVSPCVCTLYAQQRRTLSNVVSRSSRHDTSTFLSFFHPALGVTQPVPVIKYGRFPPRSLRFQQVRLDTYCRLWCMGTDSTCICEVPSLYLNKSPSEKSSDTAFQNCFLLPYPYLLAVYGHRASLFSTIRRPS